MKIRPLIIGEAQKADIARVVAYAQARPLSLEELKQTVAGKRKPPGDEPGFTCVLPVGYRCVYSEEMQPGHGLSRHLSISVLGDGEAPNEAAVGMIAREFGFRGKLDRMGQDEIGAIWTEPIEEGKVAVNIVQRKEPLPPSEARAE